MRFAFQASQREKIRIAANLRAKQLESLEQPKDNDNLYIQYLRLLDAIYQNANDTEIYFYLYYEMFYAVEKDEGNNETDVTIKKEKETSEEKQNKLTNIPKTYEEFLMSPKGCSYKDNYPIDKFQKKVSLHRKQAENLRDGGYVSLAKSVSHYINKTLLPGERGINKKI